MYTKWDASRRQVAVQALDIFQSWTLSWSAQMDQFYEDWLDSMLLLESRSQFGTRLTEYEYDQLREAIERAQLHDLLKQHVEHVQSFLERSRENYAWTQSEKQDDLILDDVSVYPFVRAIEVLLSIVLKSIDRMSNELELWQSVFNGWESVQEFHRAWPEMDLRFADMQAVLIEGRKKTSQLKLIIEMKQPSVEADQRERFDQAVIQELDPLMRRLRSVYERQSAAQVVSEMQMNVGSGEGEIIFFEENIQRVSDDSVEIKLSDSLTIYAIKSEHRSILDQTEELFDAGKGTLVADGSGVLDIDASGLQLLIALSQACESKGITFQLLSPSDVLVHWMKRSGAQMTGV